MGRKAQNSECLLHRNCRALSASALATRSASSNAAISALSTSAFATLSASFTVAPSASALAT
eukprot:CAMPEP_0174697318 /NCGR_PEP_ID=MMETSP1094-20130205/3214_1 /TAXON_ID=156173 /ORGANISM="Chrysochromulina brevifilum, Strain UTEX LB 985" /LENGTH=61 /DNA_ID=CAMNT_0015894271 /DNA_START=327 /DNA_END=509 /DNA_ORIENTATION=-